MALWSTRPLTEMSTRNLHGAKGRPVRKADNLAAICELIVKKKKKNMGVSMSQNPTGLHGQFTRTAWPLFFFTLQLPV
jgi:hypothetical protein